MSAHGRRARQSSVRQPQDSSESAGLKLQRCCMLCCRAAHEEGDHAEAVLLCVDCFHAVDSLGMCKVRNQSLHGQQLPPTAASQVPSLPPCVCQPCWRVTALLFADRPSSAGVCATGVLRCYAAAAHSASERLRRLPGGELQQGEHQWQRLVSAGS